MKINIVEINNNKIAKAIQFNCENDIEEYISIPLEQMTEEEQKRYKQHKQKRNKRVYKNRFDIDYKGEEI